MKSIKIRDHWARVAAVGCIVTTIPQIELHHARSGSMSDCGIQSSAGKKTSDYLVIPLCLDLHRGSNGIHTIGVRTFEKRYGTQIMHLKKLSDILELDLFELAGFTWKMGRYEVIAPADKESKILLHDEPLEPMWQDMQKP